MGVSQGLDWLMVRRLLTYVRGHRFLLIATFIFLIASHIAGSFHPFLIKIGVDRYIAAGDREGLIRIAWILLAVLVASFLFEIAFNYLMEYLGQRLLYDMRLDLFQKVLLFSQRYFDEVPVGQTLTNVTNDVEAIREFISEGLVTVLGDLLKIGLILVIMAAINWRLALITFMVIPFFAGATIYFRNSIRRGFQGVRAANSDINRTMVESLTGYKELALFAAKATTTDEFDRHNRQYLNSYLKVVHSYSLYFPVIDLVSNLVLVFILLFMYFYLGKYVALGDIYAYFVYVNMVFFPLRNMAEKFNTFQSAMAASERVFRLLDRKVEIIDSPGAIHLEHPPRGEIEFCEVDFAYTPGTPVLQKVSFKIHPGEKVAIVGKTGAGKSTIIHLLNRFYEVSGGKITLDGIDIRKLEIQSLRRYMATIPQNMFLFTGTIRDNITLFNPEIHRKTVQRAARQINASEFIERLPSQYEEIIVEEGRSLSMGQKQLLSFCRPLVGDAAIILLDEATSNVDSHSEKMIEEAIKKLFQQKTGILIAHRLSTIQSVDRILVMAKGRLMEEGSHEELIRKRGIYSKLYRIQSLSQS